MEPWENEQQDGRLKPNHTKITLNIKWLGISIIDKRQTFSDWTKKHLDPFVCFSQEMHFK